jgi:proline iminopeptidase
MKTPIALLAAAGLVAAALAQQPKPVAVVDLAAEQAAIRALFERHRLGIEARSVATVMRTFANTGPLLIWTGSDRAPITDRPALERLYQDWFASAQDIRMADTCVQVRVHPSGQAAWAGYFTDESETVNGKRTSERLRATFGLEKHGETWGVVQAHWSEPNTADTGSAAPATPSLSTVAPKEVVVAGFRLNYTIEGEGIPCLVITDAIAMRRALPRGLRSRFKLIFMSPRMEVPYEPGFDLKRITLDTLLDDIERVRQAAGVDRVIVFGHSINSITAYEYARKNPDHVLGVIMNGAQPFNEQRLAPIGAAHWDKVASPARKEALRRSQERTREAIAKLPPGEAALQGYIASAAMIWHDPTYDPAWLFAGVRWNAEIWDHLSATILDGYDLLKRPAISVPVLLTLGRDDFVDPLQVWDGVEKTFPNVTVRIFEQSGHWPAVDEPAHFERTLCDWGDAAVLQTKPAVTTPLSPPK